VIAIALIGGLSRFVQEYFAGAIGASVSVQLGQEMYENIMRLSISFFEQRTSGEILARFTNDVFMVNRGLAGVFVRLFREPIKAVFFLILALKMDWSLTLTVLLVLPAIAYVMVSFGRKIKKSVRRSLEKIALMASAIAETVRGIIIVKAYCMEAYEIVRVRIEFGKLRKYLKKMVKADASVEPATEFLMVIGVVIFVLLANHAVEVGRLDSGKLVILFGALAAMMDPLRKLAVVNNLIQTSVASAERVFEFIDLKPDVVEAPDAIDLPLLRQALRFENVHFSYDGTTEVLRGIDLEIRKGEMVALVGFSGAGKSTIVKLIPRFYDVTGGAITLDGVDIRRGTFKSLRDQISIVTQDTILFNEAIRNNIAFGRTTYSKERVRQAAVAAHAAEFIERLRDRYETVIGESGGTLSSGQRQRLAIARAIIKDPTILILDEATSSLDSESEQAIQRAIEEFVVGRTSIVIAHRLSTIQRADRILVVDDGRIVEQGTHQELIARGGLYRRLYDVQFAAARQEAEP
jgi:subfamily B ATP-binding cassette protein MsbA